ncbi:MAG TPA: Nif3-like dinuclear metal center hexameric protein [Longimicrobiales bacterium]|nr:Nif3-like dinuclear metal center hexameric protein [Longimicrobiales bacterium]
MATDLSALVEYLDDYLDIAEIRDYPNALNGLQVESERPVGKVAVAVDATAASIGAAAREGCDLLLVHHGLFWDGNRPVTGRRYRRLKAILEHGLAVYACHLPLDAHPEVGNNAVLARELGVELRGRFAAREGVDLGVWGELRITREALCARLDELLGVRVKLIAGGPERVERVGVVTGAGGSQVEAALAAGLDALVTGEGTHHAYFDAQEGGLNLYYGGHYATETWGVRALGAHLEERFGLPWVFIDQPTGL